MAQDGHVFVLKSAGHHRLGGLIDSAAAPEFREIGLFVVPAAEGFELARPWSLELVLDLPQPDPAVPSGVGLPYRLPEKHLAKGEAAEPAGVGQVAAAPAEPRANGTTPIGAPPSTAARDPASSAWLKDIVRMALLALTGAIVSFVAILGLTQRSR